MEADVGDAIREGIQQLDAELAKNSQLLNATVGKDIVVVLGNTGSGKSTTLNWLSGKGLKSDEDGVKIHLVDPNEEGVLAIGNGLDCQTIIPQSIVIKDVEFYDLPGFYDTRGEFEELINVAYIKQILEKAASVRIMFVFSQSEIDVKRAEAVKQLLNALESMLGDCYNKVVKDSSFFIMTKSQYRNMERVRTNFADLPDKGDTIQFLIDRIDEKKMFQVRKPVEGEDGFMVVKGDKDLILDALKASKGTKLSNLNFSCIYSERAKDILKAVFNELYRQKFDEMVPDFKTLKTITSFRQAIEKVKGPYDRDFQNFWSRFDAAVDALSIIQLLQPLAADVYSTARKEFEERSEMFLQQSYENWKSQLENLRSSFKVEIEKRMKEVAFSFVEQTKKRIDFNGKTIDEAQAKKNELDKMDTYSIGEQILSELQNNESIKDIIQQDEPAHTELFTIVLQQFRDAGLKQFLDDVRNCITLSKNICDEVINTQKILDDAKREKEQARILAENTERMERRYQQDMEEQQRQARILQKQMEDMARQNEELMRQQAEIQQNHEMERQQWVQPSEPAKSASSGEDSGPSMAELVLQGLGHFVGGCVRGYIAAKALEDAKTKDGGSGESGQSGGSGETGQSA